MITVSDAFKEAVREPVKQMLAYVDDGVDEITQSDDLKSLKISGSANLCKAVMRQAEAVYIDEHDYLDSYVNIGIGVMLPDETDKGAVTITIANPAVCTITTHGLNTGDRIKLTTTDTLPTGLVAGTSYYVIRKDANDFYLATTYNNAILGTKIETTGSQAGTHNLYFYPVGIGSTPEYIDYGAFKVVSLEHNEGSDEVIAKMYDRMYEALQLWDLEPTYPITMLELVQAICTELGWTLADTTFPNSTLSITEDLFTESQLSYRNILDMVAEASGSIIYFDATDELRIKQVSGTSLETLTSENLMMLKLEPQYGELNSVVLSRQPQEDNVADQDATSISTWGLNEFKIVNNLIVDGDRETYITPISGALFGIQYYPFYAETEGLGYYEFGDTITVENPATTQFEVLVMDIELEVGNGFSEKLGAKIPLKTSTAYNYAGIIGQNIKKTEIIVDKQQGEIDLINTTLESVLSLPRQSEPPASPSTNDLYLDTDDNIIYIYDGADWQPTSISASTLDDYYTAVETDVAITLATDEIVSSVAETQTTAQAGLDLANDNYDSIETVISDLTTLTQTVDALELDVIGVGGVNLLLNSTGLKGSIEEWQVFDGNGDLIDADNTGTVVQTAEVQNNTESGSAISITEQYITQSIPTLVGNTYTLYCRYKKTDGCDVTISALAESVSLGATEDDWDIFKQQFTATDTTTTITFDTTPYAGETAIIGDIICKIGDANAWDQAPNEVYGTNFRFDKDGFSITSETNTFKATLDEDSLTVQDTATSTVVMQVSKDESILTNTTVQEGLNVQRYEESASSLRIIPVSDGAYFVIND